ncbi:hypothetical protein LTS10_006427 [Elasticomyces elasticus]|nr:hypothetical protein LTS10_006427 [Elasticomyces elasticus]
MDSHHFSLRQITNDANWLEEALAMELELSPVAAASSEAAASAGRASRPHPHQELTEPTLPYRTTSLPGSATTPDGTLRPDHDTSSACKTVTDTITISAVGDDYMPGTRRAAMINLAGINDEHTCLAVNGLSVMVGYAAPPTSFVDASMPVDKPALSTTTSAVDPVII